MKFKDINTGHLYVEVFNRGLFMSADSKTTYTLKEALNAKNLILLDNPQKK